MRHQFTTSTRLVVLLLSLAVSAACALHADAALSLHPHRLFRIVGSLRGGSSSSTEGSNSNSHSDTAESLYRARLEQTKAKVLQQAKQAIDPLAEKIVLQGIVVDDFGAQADAIIQQALQSLSQQVSQQQQTTTGASVDHAVLLDRTLEDLEAAVDAPLQVLFLRQLALLREAALQRFRTSTKTTGVSDYEAMLQADAQFVSQAEKSSRSTSSSSSSTTSNWDYTQERSFLQAILNNFAETSRVAQDAALSASQQQQTAMQFLQSQQQMIQQLQQQLYGQSSPWNVGLAYRIPDTNFNVQGSYQQGRANVQLSCVPDEYAAFLGPNGFTNGVGPGNLGLSVNLSV
jgi:hypothetical protein